MQTQPQHNSPYILTPQPCDPLVQIPHAKPWCKHTPSTTPLTSLNHSLVRLNPRAKPWCKPWCKHNPSTTPYVLTPQPCKIALVQSPGANTAPAQLLMSSHPSLVIPWCKALVQRQPQHNSLTSLHPNLYNCPGAKPSCKHNPSTTPLCPHTPAL